MGSNFLATIADESVGDDGSLFERDNNDLQMHIQEVLSETFAATSRKSKVKPKLSYRVVNPNIYEGTFAFETKDDMDQPYYPLKFAE